MSQNPEPPAPDQEKIEVALNAFINAKTWQDKIEVVKARSDLLHIRGAVAEYERTLIAERMRRGRQQTLRAGTMAPCGHPPYGNRSDPAHPRNPHLWRVEETEAAPVVFIFDWYLQIGQSLCGLAKRLSELGPPRAAQLFGRLSFLIDKEQTGHQELFVDINPTTASIQDLHQGSSL